MGWSARRPWCVAHYLQGRGPYLHRSGHAHGRSLWYHWWALWLQLSLRPPLCKTGILHCKHCHNFNPAWNLIA